MHPSNLTLRFIGVTLSQAKNKLAWLYNLLVPNDAWRNLIHVCVRHTKHCSIVGGQGVLRITLHLLMYTLCMNQYKQCCLTINWAGLPAIINIINIIIGSGLHSKPVNDNADIYHCVIFLNKFRRLHRKWATRKYEIFHPVKEAQKSLHKETCHTLQQLIWNTS